MRSRPTIPAAVPGDGIEPLYVYDGDGTEIGNGQWRPDLGDTALHVLGATGIQGNTSDVRPELEINGVAGKEKPVADKPAAGAESLESSAGPIEVGERVAAPEGYSEICDDLSGCFTRCPSGSCQNWGYVTGETPTDYNNHAYWTYNWTSPLDWATWKPNLDYAGYYDVYVWYPHFPGVVPERTPPTIRSSTELGRPPSPGTRQPTMAPGCALRRIETATLAQVAMSNLPTGPMRRNSHAVSGSMPSSMCYWRPAFLQDEQHQHLG